MDRSDFLTSVIDRLRSGEEGSEDLDLGIMKALGEAPIDAEAAGCRFWDDGRKSGHMPNLYTTSIHPERCHWECLPDGWEWENIFVRYGEVSVIKIGDRGIMADRKGFSGVSVPYAMLIAALELLKIESAVD